MTQGKRKHALFFDIDGTLVDSYHGETTVRESVREQCRRLQDEGHMLFISSGRPKTMVDHEILDIGFDGFVFANGGYVEINGVPVYEDCMDTEKVKAVCELMESMHCEYLLETRDETHLDKNSDHLYYFFKKYGMDRFNREFDLSDVVNRTLKIETILQDGQWPKIEAFLQTKDAEGIKCDFNGTANVCEFYPNTISKAIGIEKVLEYCDIPRENTYAFGDGVNDLEMIEFCHTGVAMGNAVDELKEVAQDICGSIEDDGLAEYLKNLK